MSFSVGIVGLPNVGKSTFFKALTKKPVDIAPYPFTTIHPNVGIVAVPDERLKRIAEIVKPEKITPTIIEFVDIAGLVKNAHKGEGLGNQFLAEIRNCDAIAEIVRIFEKDEVEHVQGNIEPARDIEIIKTELLMKDLETLEKIMKNLEKSSLPSEKLKEKKTDLFNKIRDNIARGKLISEIPFDEEELREIKEFQFLTKKPLIYILNAGEEAVSEDLKNQIKNFCREPVFLNLKLEEELSELSESEAKEMELKSELDRIILACYNILDLITFYTMAGGKETRAWTIKKNSEVPEAGGVIHSDFKEKFIRAEAINWEELTKAGSWNRARELGALKTVGHDYIVKDGDVIEFKI